MKLTLSEIHIKVERRYKLDEPVTVESRNGDSYHITEFGTITRTYEYGPDETTCLARGYLLTKAGSRSKAAGKTYITDVELTTERAAPFLAALDRAVDENQ